MHFLASLVFCLCLFHCGQPQEEEEACVILKRNLADGRCPVTLGQPCADTCSGRPIVGRTSCGNAQHCCFVNETCYLNLLTSANANTQINSKSSVAQQFIDDATGDNRIFTPGVGITEIQNLFPGFVISPKFPDSCPLLLENIQPPINIPYCQRTVCSPLNPFLDQDASQCLSYPGCAYDFELFLYRTFLNQAILPGVPVCHLAIRNEAFHRHANQYIQQSNNTWNPLLTGCLIDIYASDILALPRECAVVSALRELGYRPKHAGWKSISERDCSLINGCWIDKTCLYPYSSTSIRVKTNIRQPLLFNFIQHGRPTCLPFPNNLTNGGFLDAYHTCLKSGCLIDANIETLMQHIRGAAIANLPFYLRNQFWTMGLLGQVRADNWKQVADRLVRDTANNNLLNRIIPPGQTTFDTGPPRPGGVSLFPFSIAINSSSGSVQQTPFSSFGTFGQFGSSPEENLPGTDPDSRQQNGNGGNTGQRLSLANIASSANRQVSSSTDRRNSRNLFAGLGATTGNTVGVPTLDLDFFPCLFQPIQWPNLPPLLGSFEGCCETSLCYTPTTTLRDVHSEIASYTTLWTTWGPCSASCGGGSQTRRRFCIGESCEGDEDKQEEENQACNLEPCPQPIFSPWSEYSPCSATCGNGFKIRNRICLRPIPCPGEIRQSMPCRTRQCISPSRPTLNGRWSPCSVTCGRGFRTRAVLSCSSGGSCTTIRTERMPCELFCGTIQSQSVCNIRLCYYEARQQCLLPTGQPGHCEGLQPSSRTNRKCYNGRCCRFHFPRNPRACRNPAFG